MKVIIVTEKPSVSQAIAPFRAEALAERRNRLRACFIQPYQVPVSAHVEVGGFPTRVRAS